MPPATPPSRRRVNRPYCLPFVLPPIIKERSHPFAAPDVTTPIHAGRKLRRPGRGSASRNLDKTGDGIAGHDPDETYDRVRCFGSLGRYGGLLPKRKALRLGYGRGLPFVSHWRFGLGPKANSYAPLTAGWLVWEDGGRGRPEMSNTVHLSEEEANFIRGFVAKHDLPAEPYGAVAYWLERWAKFVSEVEEGYGFTIYDYADDLSVHWILEDIMKEGPDSLRRKLEAWLEPWDNRFFAATRPVVNPLGPEPLGLLHRIERIPNAMGEELETDLRDNGFID